jgi:hypothetical protein
MNRKDGASVAYALFGAEPDQDDDAIEGAIERGANPLSGPMTASETPLPDRIAPRDGSTMI